MHLWQIFVGFAGNALQMNIMKTNFFNSERCGEAMLPERSAEPRYGSHKRGAARFKGYTEQCTERPLSLPPLRVYPDKEQPLRK